jgi:hypothetical protein
MPWGIGLFRAPSPPKFSVAPRRCTFPTFTSGRRARQNPLHQNDVRQQKNKKLQQITPGEIPRGECSPLGRLADFFHLLPAADLGVGVRACWTRTRFLVGQRRSALLTDITISNVSRHFHLQSWKSPHRHSISRLAFVSSDCRLGPSAVHHQAITIFQRAKSSGDTGHKPA